MTAIYSSAALKTRQREVKDAARKEVVHITENGNAAFVLCSEEIFQQKLDEAAEQAAYAERMRAALLDGKADAAEGNVVEGTDAFFELVHQKLAQRGDTRLGDVSHGND